MADVLPFDLAWPCSFGRAGLPGPVCLLPSDFVFVASQAVAAVDSPCHFELFQCGTVRGFIGCAIHRLVLRQGLKPLDIVIVIAAAIVITVITIVVITVVIVVAVVVVAAVVAIAIAAVTAITIAVAAIPGLQWQTCCHLI